MLDRSRFRVALRDDMRFMELRIRPALLTYASDRGCLQTDPGAARPLEKDCPAIGMVPKSNLAPVRFDAVAVRRKLFLLKPSTHFLHIKIFLAPSPGPLEFYLRKLTLWECDLINHKRFQFFCFHFRVGRFKLAGNAESILRFS